LCLRKYQLGLFEKRLSRRRQHDATRTARHERDANLLLERADLTTERRLRGVQPLLGGHRHAAFLGNRDIIAEMPQLRPKGHAQ